MQLNFGKLYFIQYKDFGKPVKAYMVPQRMSSDGFIFYYHIHEPHIDRMLHISSVTRGDYIVEEVNGNPDW